MKLSQMQLVVLSVGTFVGIIALNILSRYRSDETFRDQWSKIPQVSLDAFKTKLVAQENMVSVPNLNAMGDDGNVVEPEENDGDTGNAE